MAQTVRFVDTISYTEADQADFNMRMMRPQGVISESSLGALVVSAIGGMSVRVSPGEAFIQGFQYGSTTNVDLTIAANASGSTRFDYVVLRLNRTANTLLLAILQGIAGAGSPTLTQVVGGTWEFPLAQITIVNNASSIAAGSILDTRVLSRWPVTALDSKISAQGAPSTVFGVNAAGVLGYYPVTSNMITDGTIVNTDIAPATIRGGVDGVNGRIVAGTINTQDIQDRGILGGDIAVGAITNVEIADNTITNNEIAPNSIHPGRLSSWADATYRYNVLYDTGGGISVSQVSDLLCAVNSIHANKLLNGSIGLNQMGTGSVDQTKMVQHSVSGSYYNQFVNATTYGAGGWPYPGGGISLGGTPGETLVHFTFTCALIIDTPNAIVSAGVGVDNSSSPNWTTSATAQVANQVVNLSICIEHTLTNTSNAYYPLIQTNAGTIRLYGNAQVSALVLYK